IRPSFAACGGMLMALSMASTGRPTMLVPSLPRPARTGLPAAGACPAAFASRASRRRSSSSSDLSPAMLLPERIEFCLLGRRQRRLLGLWGSRSDASRWSGPLLQLIQRDAQSALNGLPAEPALQVGGRQLVRGLGLELRLALEVLADLAWVHAGGDDGLLPFRLFRGGQGRAEKRLALDVVLGGVVLPPLRLPGTVPEEAAHRVRRLPHDRLAGVLILERVHGAVGARGESAGLDEVIDRIRRQGLLGQLLPLQLGELAIDALDGP